MPDRGTLPTHTASSSSLEPPVETAPATQPGLPLTGGSSVDATPSGQADGEPTTRASTLPDFRDDKILSNVMRVRARLGLIEASGGVWLPTEIRLLDEVIVLLLPKADDGDPSGQLEGE